MRISPVAMAQRVSRARRRLRAIYPAQNPPESGATAHANPNVVSEPAEAE
jgi:hypothetical protein